MGTDKIELGTRGVIESFLQRARQRHLLQLGLDAGTYAAIAACVGAILLLLAGTQILNWWWPAALFVVGFAVALWRVRGRVVGPYTVAQRIDKRLELHDAVSSAFYFRNLSTERPTNLDTIVAQAEQGLASADLKQAMPMRTPAGALVLAAAVLMAVSLFGIRYGITGRLDLAAPIADLNFDIFPSPEKAQAATKKSAVQENFEKQLEQFGLSLEELDTKVQNSEATTDQAVGTEGSPEGNVPMQTNQKGGEASDKKGESSSETGDSADKGDKAEPGGQGDEQTPGDEGKQGGKQQSTQNGKQGQNDGSQGGVMDKMRDALSNLMAKMRSQSKSEKDSQGSQQGQSQQDRQQQAANKGMQGQSRSQGDGQQSADQKSDQGGDGGEKLEAGQSKPSEKGSDKQSNQEGKSGVGKTDGAKEVKEAEQLAAMGKISELIGKRAQQITGEMTVEVPSSKQQLRTAYTGKRATHENTGAEVHRDEIPLDFQAYVQRYFEEVRKAPAVKKDAGAKVESGGKVEPPAKSAQ